MKQVNNLRPPEFKTLSLAVDLLIVYYLMM
jgi:hypothetical protein